MIPWSGSTPHLHASVGRAGPRRWAAIGLGLIAALTAVLAAPAQPAYAHAQLTGTTPANGARLDTAPAEIVLEFSERVNLVRDGVRLLDAAGAVRDTGPAVVDPTTGRRVRMSVPAGLGTGTYTVSWRVVSADSHPIHGAFAFGVGDVQVVALPDSGAQATSDPGLATAFWLFRWLGYAGLALLSGGLAFLLICWPAGWATRRTRILLLAGWATSLVSAVAVLLTQGPYANGGTLGSLADPALLTGTLGTDYGRFVLARLTILLLGGLLLYWLLRRPADGQTAVVARAAAVLAVALPITWIGTGHANAEASLLARLADATHLTAMAVWFGGLVLLVTAVLSRAEPRPVAEVGATLTRFSTVAMICVGVLVVTGTYQAWRGVGSLSALAGSSYGRLLVFKLAAIGVLLWFGAMSRSVVQRRYVTPAVRAAGESTVDEPELALAGPPVPAARRRASGNARTVAASSASRTAAVSSASRTAAPGSANRAAQSSANRAAPSSAGRTAVSGANRAAVADGVGRAAGASRNARRADRAEREQDQLARKQLRWSVRIEVAIGIAVLAITAQLVATPPGARPAAAEAVAPSTVATQQVGMADGGRIEIELDPARVGPSALTVLVSDPAGRPWDVPEVTANLSLHEQGLGPLPVTLQRVGPGEYASSGLSLPMAGTWQVQVKVRTTEIDQELLQAHLTVG